MFVLKRKNEKLVYILPDWLVDVVGFNNVTVRGGGGGGITGSKCNFILDFSIDGLLIMFDIDSVSTLQREEPSLALLAAYVLWVCNENIYTYHGISLDFV